MMGLSSGLQDASEDSGKQYGNGATIERRRDDRQVMSMIDRVTMIDDDVSVVLVDRKEESNKGITD